jgi:glutathione S-transferase
VLDDGRALPESDTIVEFLADAFPDAGLRPANPFAAAQGRLIARVVDLYVLPRWPAVFFQLLPAAPDPAKLEPAIAGLDEELGRLDLVLTDATYAVSDRISTADCALVPLAFYLSLFSQVFGRDLFAGHEKFAAYWSRVKDDPAVRQLTDEFMAGLRAAPRVQGLAALV